MKKMQAENKKSDIRTLSFGCRLNSLETEKIQSGLKNKMDRAIIINTCAVTHEAERQSGQAVRKIARENPGVTIFVTGCAATRNPGLFADIKGVTVIPNSNKMNIEAYIAAPDAINNAPIIKFDHPTPRMSKQFVQVQNGCNHKCAYCVTRLLRGAAQSFEYKDILVDAQCAINNGFSEIVLTGVDIASYAKDGRLISDVCRGILTDVPGVARLRLSSMDPASPEIFKIMDIMEQDTRMPRHMHLSMQSGSDTILRAMGRRHNSNLVRKIAERGNQIGVTFSWDIICGFPGETNDLFNETMQLIQQTRPIKIHAFPFSPRPDTPAANMDAQVLRETSKARVKIITEETDKIRADYMRGRIGHTTQVLVEENNIARDTHDIPVIIQGPTVPERTVCNVVLTGIDGDRMIGEIK